MKKCGKCKSIKSLDSFYKSKSSSNGFQNRCKDCSKASKKKWAKENKKHVKESKKKWDKENKEHCKSYREKNKENIKRNTKNWYIKNKDKKFKREKDRLSNDLIFKLKHNIRRNIRTSINKSNYTKNSSTFNILGCDYSFFYEWLGINDGVFHLDHIIPISLAETENEVYTLNHYSNFQAISPNDNLSKGNRYIIKVNYERVLKNHPKPQLIKNIVEKSGIEIIG